MARNVHDALMVELWLRLPLKKVMQMKLVSKEWASLIESSSNFIMSKQPPRILYTYVDGLQRRKFRIVPEDLPLGPFTETWNIVNVSSYAAKGICSQPVKGLICIYKDDGKNYKVDVCNFLTGKSVNLPDLQKDVSDLTSVFFGVNPINNQFKVLCVCVRYGLATIVKPRVLSLEGKQSSWRGIGCAYPHSPTDHLNSSGLYKDGVIYYGAMNVKKELLVMTFDLNKEVFCPINLGVVVPHAGDMRIVMVNYYGSVALVIRRPLTDGARGVRFEMHVLDNAKEWTMLHFLIGDIEGSNPKYKPRFCVGTTASNGVIFAPEYIFNRADTKKQRPFHKIELALSLCCFHPSNKGFLRDITWDKFTEEIDSLTYIGLQTFLGTVVTYINPEQLLA